MKKPKWNLEWNDGMSVGIPEIDADHRRFILLIDELNSFNTSRTESTEIKNRLQLIVEDAERHFKQEEEYFLDCLYPDTKRHARAHDQILHTVHEVLDSFMPYGLDAEWTDAAQIIKNILIGHVLNDDMEYVNYFKSIKS